MIPPINVTFQQGYAEPICEPVKGFASQSMASHSCRQVARPTVRAYLCDDCTPSPSRQSGPTGARPSPLGHVVSGLAAFGSADEITQEFCFSSARIVVLCRTITNLTRGRKTWSSQSSFWAQSLFFHSQAACRTPQRAVWQALAPVSFWRMRLTPTWQRVRSLAVSRAWPPAASISVCPPATSAALTVAPRGLSQISRRHPGRRPGGVFAFAATKVT